MALLIKHKELYSIFCNNLYGKSICKRVDTSMCVYISHTHTHTHTYNVLCLVAQSYLTFCGPIDCRPPGSSVYEDSPGKSTGMGCHALLQGIFPPQGSNRGFPHHRCILYHLHYQESLYIYIYIYI